MYDVNEAFGVFAQMMTIAQMEALSPFYTGNPTARPLCTNLLLDAPSKQELTYWFCELLQPNKFSNAKLDPKIDSLANRIRTDVYADPNKFYTNQNFEDNQVMNISTTGPGGGNFPGLKSFITNRRNSLMSSLAPFGCYLGVGETSADISFALFPVPASDIIHIVSNEDVREWKIYGLAGDLLLYEQGHGAKTIQLDITNLPSLIYFLQVNGLNMQKFIVSK